uniref:Uncharacterized protein n=1 Tax=Rhizophora mucronata TaxID=61149 RepID=A0A2P2P138_RHIMU
MSNKISITCQKH